MDAADKLMMVRAACPEAMLADGFDECIIGISCGFGPVRVVYSYEQVITKLIAGGMNIDEAREFFAFNIGGSYVGEYTPIFVELLEELDQGDMLSWPHDGEDYT